MKLVAANRIEGVNTLTGKGKGTSTAFVGDIFEVDKSEEQRLIDLGAATEYRREDPLAGIDDGEEKKPARKPAARKGKSQKAEDGSDTANEEDLGL